MDENTHLPEGTVRGPDESILKPGTSAAGSSATPVNEPVIPETLQVTQSLWPDADSVTPAPVSISSKPDAPTVVAPFGASFGTPPSAPLNASPAASLGAPLNMPPSTPPEHVSATSLIGSSPIEPQPVSPAVNFTGQPAPDPYTRAAASSKESPRPTGEPKASATPAAPRDPGSTAEYPPLKMIGADVVTPAMGARLSSYQKSTEAATETGELGSNIPATSHVSTAPAAPAAATAPSIPSVSGAPSAPSEASATQAEPMRLEVHTKAVEPVAYSEPVTPSTPVAPAVPTTPATPAIPTAPAAYGAQNEPAGQVTLNFGEAAPLSPAAQPAQVDEAPQAAAEGFAATAITEQPAIIPAAQTAPEETPVAEPIAEEATAAVEQITREQLAVASVDQLAPDTERPEPIFGEPIEVEEEPVEKGISVITREATVLGDILTEGHIDIVGRVKGNIDAKGDVAIHGIVRGDIDGSKIGLYSCRVKGNLNAGLGVIVDDNSVIGGDVKTKNIIFDGKVKGNIDADNVVVLRSHSYCLGDVSAASLAVEPGAILNGKVRTFVDGDLEAPFDEVM